MHEKHMPKTSLRSRCKGALYGLYIGDALAMPVHWYYDRAALVRDYGRVTDYLAPRNPHPDSILWRASYTPVSADADILHDQARFWGQPGVHYHQFLRAGENTLNIKLCTVLITTLNELGRYDVDAYCERYIAFMTTPGTHRDTYVEECHRHFFTCYARGHTMRQAGIQEKHIGGLAGIIPIIIFFAGHGAEARAAALTHLSLTHPGPAMAAAAELLADILLSVLAGAPLRDVVTERINRQASPLLGHPFFAWLDMPDDQVIGPQLSTACYVVDSVPAAVYLALKYHDRPEAGLIANTNLGGDNAYRGAVLGALLGAANGFEALPARWVTGLIDPPPEIAS